MKQLCLCSVTAIWLLAALTSCKKDKEAKTDPVCPCQVKKIVQKIPGLEQRTGTFTYNAAGDPTDFTPTSYTTGSVKYEFRYDANRRLTDYIGYYPGSPGLSPFFEFWVKYKYDASGRVFQDTSYMYGIYGAQITTFHAYKTVTTYEYDHMGRISRTVSRQLKNDAPTGTVSDYKYTYNDDGNLVKPGASYDQKMNVHRTNRIWMFLNRNYSNNNLRAGTSYNNYGLPLGFAKVTGQTPSLGMLAFFGFNDCEIEYECK